MARESDPQEVLDAEIIEYNALVTKIIEFETKGKIFRYDSYTGIIPDKIYDSLREPTDPKYRKGV